MPLKPPNGQLQLGCPSTSTTLHTEEFCYHETADVLDAQMNFYINVTSWGKLVLHGRTGKVQSLNFAQKEMHVFYFHTMFSVFLSKMCTPEFLAVCVNWTLMEELHTRQVRAKLIPRLPHGDQRAHC